MSVRWMIRKFVRRRAAGPTGRSIPLDFAPSIETGGECTTRCTSRQQVERHFAGHVAKFLDHAVNVDRVNAKKFSANRKFSFSFTSLRDQPQRHGDTEWDKRANE